MHIKDKFELGVYYPVSYSEDLRIVKSIDIAFIFPAFPIHVDLKAHLPTYFDRAIIYT